MRIFHGTPDDINRVAPCKSYVERRRGPGDPIATLSPLINLLRAVSVLAVLLDGFLRGGWLDAVLVGIALGMSMLPEEFPVVLTVFMAMGAWRIARARVLTRRAAAIETLGSATVLCSDKTGTLTENRMSIAELRLTSGESFRARDASAATNARGVSRPGRVRHPRECPRAI